MKKQIKNNHQGDTKMKEQLYKVYQYKNEEPNKDGKFESTLDQAHGGSYPFSTNPSQGTQWWMKHSGHGRNFLSIVEPQLQLTLTVICTDLEDVFYAGNHAHDLDVDESKGWMERNIYVSRRENSYSVSVGDVVEDKDGNKFVVDNFGFTELDAKGNIVLNKRNTIK